MKKSDKMNWMFKAGFILLMLCIVLFFVAIIVAYLLKRPNLSTVFSGGGALLAFVGIILTMFSKPKKKNTDIAVDENEEIIQTDESIAEFDAD